MQLYYQNTNMLVGTVLYATTRQYTRSYLPWTTKRLENSTTKQQTNHHRFIKNVPEKAEKMREQANMQVQCGSIWVARRMDASLRCRPSVSTPAFFNQSVNIDGKVCDAMSATNMYLMSSYHQIVKFKEALLKYYRLLKYFCTQIKIKYVRSSNISKR